MLGGLRILVVVAAMLGMGGVAFALAPPQACACSCADPGPPREAVAGYDAVFVGVPVDESSDGDQTVYEFEVSAVYTGEVKSRTTVATNAGGGSCGKSYEMGEEALVFAGAGTKDDAAPFTSHLCGPYGTRAALTDATEEVYGPPSAPEPASVEAASNAPGESGGTAGTIIAVVGVVMGIAAVVTAPVLWWRSARG